MPAPLRPPLAIGTGSGILSVGQVITNIDEQNP
jgi:hypothetical protein